MITREELEKIEKETLAPYAQCSGQSRGRQFPETEHPYRTAFQRDRDRIIHSSAFRRLQYKTQVFVNYEGIARWGRIQEVSVHGLEKRLFAGLEFTY